MFSISWGSTGLENCQKELKPSSQPTWTCSVPRQHRQGPKSLDIEFGIHCWPGTKVKRNQGETEKFWPTTAFIQAAVRWHISNICSYHLTYLSVHRFTMKKHSKKHHKDSKSRNFWKWNWNAQHQQKMQNASFIPRTSGRIKKSRGCSGAPSTKSFLPGKTEPIRGRSDTFHAQDVIRQMFLKYLKNLTNVLSCEVFLGNDWTAANQVSFDAAVRLKILHLWILGVDARF